MKKVCNLCQLEKIPDFEDHQPLIEFEDLRAHYFCLLFSSGLGQSGQESEGLQGFIASDVRRELKRGARLKCVYCKLKGATVGCAKAECKKSYHLPCGMKHGSLQEFFDQYKSFCSLHRPVQKLSRAQVKQQKKNLSSCNKDDQGSSQCSICQDPVTPKPGFKSILAPCCTSGSWFHRSCLQKLALNNGQAHFRCPLCNNNDKFCTEMKRLGLYVPSKPQTDQSQGSQCLDPESGGALLLMFAQLGAKECGAKVCFCDHIEGRKYNSLQNGGFWEILVCFSCQACAIHAKCGGMEDLIDPQWNCYICRRVKSKTQDDGNNYGVKNAERPINEVWGTALGRKPPNKDLTISQQSESSKIIVATPDPVSNKATIEFSNSVTITPIPKHQIKEHHSHFPMRNGHNSGIEISMVNPTKNYPKAPKPDTMRLSLDDIILAGLERKPEVTSYQCTKAFVDQFEARPVLNGANNGQISSKKRNNSFDTEHGSPGDSDYESAQEQQQNNGQIPFKIRRNASVTGQKTAKNVDMGQNLVTNAQFLIDSRIQKSIKDFFNSS